MRYIVYFAGAKQGLGAIVHYGAGTPASLGQLVATLGYSVMLIGLARGADNL
jgi:hypothetical protein